MNTGVATSPTTLLAAIMEASEDAIISTTPDGVVTQWSPGAERMLGYAAAEVVGRPLVTIVPPQLVNDELALVSLVAGEGRIARHETVHVHKDGRRLNVAVTISPVHDATTTSLEILCIARDVTEQKRGDLLRRESEERFRLIADSTPVMMKSAGIDGETDFFNKAWLKFTGRRMEEHLGIGWLEDVHAEDLQRCVDFHYAAFNERRLFQVEFRLRRHDGEYRWMCDTGAPRFDSEGRFVGYIGSCVDITDRRHAEIERRYREIEVALAHANRVATLGQLSASIAHEMKQPVAAAVTNAEAALRWLGAQPPDIGEAMQSISHIIKNGNRAGEVISRIRALAKKAPQREEWLEVNDAIREVIALIHGEVVKNGVAVRTQFAQALPPVQGDRVQLQQVVLNLVINSVEAMSGVALGSRELLISTAVAGSDVLVTVRDSGPGFARENIDRVFEAFYTTKPGGLGLGLSICNSIIQAHGGRLWASAAGAGGATLQFTLPAPPDSARVSESRASGSRA